MDEKKKLTQLQRECVWLCSKMLEPIEMVPSCQQMCSMFKTVLQDVYFTNDTAHAKEAVCNLGSKIVKIRRVLESIEPALNAVQVEIINVDS